jgi:hypothetical protein
MCVTIDGKRHMKRIRDGQTRLLQLNEVRAKQSMPCASPVPDMNGVKSLVVCSCTFVKILRLTPDETGERGGSECDGEAQG